MKRFSRLFILAIFGVFLVSCNTNNEDELVEILPDDLITMEILDDYMYRDDVQYVDLRNYNASFQTGWIDGFELIPFFDYLDYRAFDRDGVYEFNHDQIVDQRELERLFDKEKAIFLYADGCIRSGYLKDVLNYLGYERVYVLGGFYEYEGIYKMDGTGDYSIGDNYYASYTNTETNMTYVVYGTYSMSRIISDIRFDILDENGETIRLGNPDTGIDYHRNLTILENYISLDAVTFTNLLREFENLEESRYHEIENFEWEEFEDLYYLFLELGVN